MTLAPKTPPAQVAGVDLGSNSFHMIVAELRAGELMMVDRIREMVRLGAGLTGQRNLSSEAQQRALACLERFGQRLRGLPPGSVRAVGTNTLRVARNAAEFLTKAEDALGHPIEIIAGIEEARLIYLGVAQGLGTDGRKRLVMDIGGGSTEFIVGIDKTPIQKESLQLGCVSMSLAHFEDGKISQKRFRRAVLSALQELEPFEHLFHRSQWHEAVGTSGTLRAVRKILSTRGWTKGDINLSGIQQLVEALLAAGRIDLLQFPDLNPERFPSFPGGVAILFAAFKALGIETLQVSDKALREGLVYDLVGRINRDDIRSDTVAALASRYHVDLEHAERIRGTLGHFIEQSEFAESEDRDSASQWLNWAATLHEIGRDIAHSGYHKHGAYILENADLPGFSRQDQALLATLVRAHRRKFPTRLFKELTPPWNEAAKPLALMLRIAILMHRNRQMGELPSVGVQFSGSGASLRFPAGWLDEHPLTRADLEQEAEFLALAQIELKFS